jgi:acetoin utilization deacetylase AcuC-like enzyme
MSTGWVWHERYMWHDTGSGAAFLEPDGFLQPGEHVENPDSKRRIRNLLEISGLLKQLDPILPREATPGELGRVHESAYIERVRELSADRGGLAGNEAPFSAGGYQIAALSAGGCIAAVDAVAAGQVENAYAMVRPPGHHAMAGVGLGFCIFNNCAVAATHALEKLGCDRVAILDWDAHHGNGAQQIFQQDPSVLTLSIHQDGAFPPGSGAWDECGEGHGLGTNLNLPVPPGSGVGAYVAVMERVVVPALKRYRPDFILVAAGLDAGPQDPLARLMVHSDGFREMTRVVRECADDICGGRLVMCHEGGYAKAYVPFCGLATIEALSGIDSGVEDPFLPAYSALPYQDLQPQQELIVSRAEGQIQSIPEAMT